MYAWYASTFGYNHNSASLSHVLLILEITKPRELALRVNPTRELAIGVLILQVTNSRELKPWWYRVNVAIDGSEGRQVAFEP